MSFLKKFFACFCREESTENQVVEQFTQDLIEQIRDLGICLRVACRHHMEGYSEVVIFGFIPNRAAIFEVSFEYTEDGIDSVKARVIGQLRSDSEKYLPASKGILGNPKLPSLKRTPYGRESLGDGIQRILDINHYIGSGCSPSKKRREVARFFGSFLEGYELYLDREISVKGRDLGLKFVRMTHDVFEPGKPGEVGRFVESDKSPIVVLSHS